MARTATLWDFDSKLIVRNLRMALNEMALLESRGISTPSHRVAVALDCFLDVVVQDVPAERVSRAQLEPSETPRDD